MKPTVTAIIQARMNSTRLPGKAMMHLAGQPLLFHVISRIQATEGVDNIVLATCGGSENNEILHLAETMGIRLFIGSEDNVLDRFYRASEKFGGDYIMRVTGDNPFTDPGYAAKTVKTALTNNADLCYFANLPLGTGVGMVKKSALDIAFQKSDKPHQFEHVTPYVKEHPEIFKIDIHDIDLHNPFPDLRLTVDAPEDFKLAEIIYQHLYNDKPFPLGDVIEFIEKNPALADINSTIKQRPMTHSSIQ